MESVLIWQIFVIASVALSRLHSKVLMVVVALGWTVWTIMAVHTSPLLTLQLFSAWGAVWIISWCSGLFDKPDKKNDNANFKAQARPQLEPVEPKKGNDNSLNAVGGSINMGLTQINEAIDRFNENLKKKAESDKLNQDFFLKLHSFRVGIEHAMNLAEMAYQSDCLYENEPEKRKIYEQVRIQVKETFQEHSLGALEGEKVELSSIPLVKFTPDISDSPVAVEQRIEKIQECLDYVAQVEKRLTENVSLIKKIDNIIDKTPFSVFLSINKHFLNVHINALGTLSPSSTNRSEAAGEKIRVKFPKELLNGVSTQKINQAVERLRRGDKIKELVTKRKIEYLVHFTRVENLPSILEKGLMGRSLLKFNNLDTLMNDNLRLDNVKDAVSTSISFPNYRMFFSLQKQNPTADWAVIKIKPSVLWELDCAFCYSNAAGRASRAVPLDDRRSPEAFEKMFDESLADLARQTLNIPDHYTTDPQAEVLVLEAVNPKYILSICFDEKAKINNFPKIASFISPYVSSVNFDHDPLMFSPRRDYQHWKSAQDENLKSDRENPYLRDFKF